MSEIDLWAAVVNCAITDANKPDRKSKYQNNRIGPRRDRAKQWLRSQSREIGSLHWICEQLGLNVDQVREKAIG